MRSPRSLARLAALVPLAPLALGLAACAPQEAPPRPAPPPRLAAPPAATTAAAAAPVLPPERPPLGQLPPGVRPLHYTLTLQILPGQDRFAGTAEILVDLDRPRSVVWMHANGLTAQRASVRPEGLAPVGARFEQVDPVGVASLTLDQPVGPGRAVLRIDYDGPLAEVGHGLYKVREAGRAYAFTQFEPTAARTAFPCFDEPAYKTPFAVQLIVPRGEAAIANAAEVERKSVSGDLDRVSFATTAPLPTYLVAFAVGPLDVVSAPPVEPTAARPRPLPLRGVAAAGRGAELAFALEHTGALVAALEEYTGISYPYDKLDMIAVPDKRGAMENPGAVTFSEWLLLLDRERASVTQRRAFFAVAAHELAHIWFGDLVTMPWWNDLWLKEASANWLGAHAVRRVRPDLDIDAARLDSVHGAMGTDGMVSARKIRQEIRDHHDISNAFDGITYDKGYGVISMFERWIGPEVYQRGVRSFLASRPFGTATMDDYLAAISEARGSDVGPAFRSFLDQPGVPLVEARLQCEGKPALQLKQSRYLPLGSAGDPAAVWQIPVCARYPADAKDGNGKGTRESCVLLSAAEGSLPLEGDRCPAWVLPNADGAGYYRWSLPAAELGQLAGAGLSRLNARERMSFAASVRASANQGATTGAAALAALAPLAGDARPEVATAPLGLLRPALDWLAGDALEPAAAAYARSLYAPAYRDLGWAPRGARPGAAAAAQEPAERALLRRDVIEFLAIAARDPAARKEAAARGRAYVEGGRVHPEAVGADLAPAALAVAVQEGDAALFDRALAALEHTEDEVARGALVRGLGSARAPDLAARARDLALDARLRPREALAVLEAQLGQPETREAAWRFLEEKLDPIIARLTPQRSGGLPWMATSFCDRAHADRASALFGTRVRALNGGPRNLAGALEAMNLCATRRKAQEPSLRAFFADAGKAKGKPRGR